MAFIYCIENTIDSKVYIGQTTRKLSTRRWSEHKQLLKKKEHSNLYLQDAWNKHGESAFNFRILCEVKTLEELPIKEKYYLDKFYPNVYNIVKPTKSSARSIQSKQFAGVNIDANIRMSLVNYCVPRRFKFNYVVEELLKAFLSGTLMPNSAYTGSLFVK